MKSAKSSGSWMLGELLGWLGVALVVGGYSMTVLEVLSVDSPMYLGMNVAGSIGLIVSSAHKRDVQPVALNVIWLGIALTGIAKLLI